jgi:hypothetical protein
MENGIYDPGSRMLRGFLAALPEHLEPGGEGWLILPTWRSISVCGPARSCSKSSRPRDCASSAETMCRRAIR